MALAVTREAPGEVAGELALGLIGERSIIALPEAPKGGKAASGLAHLMVAIDHEPIDAIVRGFDQRGVISSEGVWGCHTAGFTLTPEASEAILTPNPPNPLPHLALATCHLPLPSPLWAAYGEFCNFFAFFCVMWVR